MADKNIHVGTGIGNIENNYGDISLSQDDTFKVRLDFKSIEGDIYKLYELGKVFRYNNMVLWSHYRYKERFDDVIYDSSIEEEIQNKIIKIYEKGRDLSVSISEKLTNINSLDIYTDLTSFISDIEPLIERKLIELPLVLIESKQAYKKLNKSCYSVDCMHELFEKQIDDLKTISSTLRFLKKSGIYQQENNILDEDLNINNAPELIQNLSWFWTLLKKNIPIGTLILVLFLGYSNKDFIWNNVKHTINTKLLFINASAMQKKQVDYIFQSEITFQDFLYEIEHKNNEDPSISKNSLIEIFSALGFKYKGLINYNEQDMILNLNNFWILYADFEGFIVNKYPQFKSLHNASNALALAIKNKDKKSLELFDKNWKKFQNSFDYVIPEFDISNVRSGNEVLEKSLEIYKGIDRWLKK